MKENFRKNRFHRSYNRYGVPIVRLSGNSKQRRKILREFPVGALLYFDNVALKHRFGGHGNTHTEWEWYGRERPQRIPFGYLPAGSTVRDALKKIEESLKCAALWKHAHNDQNHVRTVVTFIK